jgi:hypothetical protein
MGRYPARNVPRGVPGAVGTSRPDCDRGSMSSTNDMAALAADFPGWHVWRGRSASGAETDWHATTSRQLRKAGALARLAAPSAQGLRALLDQQQALWAELAA